MIICFVTRVTLSSLAAFFALFSETYYAMSHSLIYGV
jgi:hypothetical protein